MSETHPILPETVPENDEDWPEGVDALITDGDLVVGYVPALGGEETDEDE